MSYSESFPAQRPIFSLDAANAGRLDPRMTFSRADTPPTYAAPSAVHYWSNEKHLSSENLATNSNNLSDWGLLDITRTLSQVGPDGSSNAAKLTGVVGTVFKAIYKTTLANTSAQTISFFAKEDTHRYIQVSVNGDATKYVNFDLNGSGAYSANGAGVTASITASGNGYLRCAVNLTLPSTSAYISLQDSLSAAREATTASTGSIYIFGAMATTLGDATNVAAYVAAGSQIHREYAPTLKSVATAGQPRFEYDPSADGQSAGMSLGILIEGQSTNAISYSDSISNWNEDRLTVSDNSAVGPTGSLNASLLTPTSANGTHSTNLSSVATNVTGTVTVSGYFKAAGYDYVTLGIGDTTTNQFAHALFNLSTGAYVANNVSGNSSYVSSSTESVGNGWWRLVATFSTTEANEKFVISPASSGTPSYNANWGVPTFAGDDYSGVLATGLQGEVGKSFASSLIASNSGSETTRAAESLSVATSSFGLTGGPVSYVAEVGAAKGYFPAVLSTTYGSNSFNEVAIQKLNASAGESTEYSYVGGDGSATTHSFSIAGSGDATVVAVTSDTNRFAGVADGGTVNTDTAGALPQGIDTLYVGSFKNSYGHINTNVKRIAVYNEALSDTNLISLTS